MTSSKKKDFSLFPRPTKKIWEGDSRAKSGGRGGGRERGIKLAAGWKVEREGKRQEVEEGGKSLTRDIAGGDRVEEEGVEEKGKRGEKGLKFDNISSFSLHLCSRDIFKSILFQIFMQNEMLLQDFVTLSLTRDFLPVSIWPPFPLPFLLQRDRDSGGGRG